MAASGSSSNLNAINNSSVINQVQASSFPNHLNFNLPLKLDYDNYVIWKSQVLPAIRAYDLEEFILGESRSPQKFIETVNEETGDCVRSVNSEFLQWKKTDQLLVCWLRSTLSPFVIGQIQATKKGSLTITEYVLKLRTMADSLAAAGQPMSDRDLILNVLQGLGSEYDAVIVNITSQHGISLQDAQFQLMSYEARLDRHNSSTSLALATASHCSVVAPKPSHSNEPCKTPLFCTYFGNKSAVSNSVSNTAHTGVNSASCVVDIDLWHRKLGHPSSKILTQHSIPNIAASSSPSFTDSIVHSVNQNTAPLVNQNTAPTPSTLPPSQPSINPPPSAKLPGTISFGLFFSIAKHLQLTAYSDADWGSCLDDRKSTSGVCIFLGNNLIVWGARKQKVVARSSTEAEYRALASAAIEVIWLQSLFSELKLPLAGIPII
ncbi:hypothetical protein ACOSP7_021775 [Xanthoceras sorbifolium]